MAKREDRRRKTLGRLVRLREMETIAAARKSADLVATQSRLASLSQRSTAIIADQSAGRVKASATELRHEYGFTQSLHSLRNTSNAQAREMDSQIVIAAQQHGQSKHREDRLKDRVTELARRANLRANHDSAAQTGEMARKLKRNSRRGGLSGASGE